MSLKAQDSHGEKEPAGIGRRRFLNAAAALLAHPQARPPSMTLM